MQCSQKYVYSLNVIPTLHYSFLVASSWKCGFSHLLSLIALLLHRALKTRGNTPKYGLIFHSTFIGRAAAKNKGRISRYLANKCTIASRIDCFSGEWRGRCSIMVFPLWHKVHVAKLQWCSYFFVNSIQPSGWWWSFLSLSKATCFVHCRHLLDLCWIFISCFTSCISEVPTCVFGDRLREQVEERLSFYETGDVPRKNVDVMKEAVKEVSSHHRALPMWLPWFLFKCSYDTVEVCLCCEWWQVSSWLDCEGKMI